MVYLDPNQTILPAKDYLESNETPVDSEDQNWIPNLLLASLLLLWASRFDWFFAVDMGIYSDLLPEVIVPDAFLALGIPRRKDPNGRLSYIVRDEQGVVPILALEMISKTYRGEYSTKKQDYATLGVLYYVIYNPGGYGPRTEIHDVLEVYRLEHGSYIRVPGDPVWMPEIGLGMGRGVTISGGIPLPCLNWADAFGRLYPHSEEQIRREQQRADQEQQRADRAEQRAAQLAQRLRDLGLDPDELNQV